MSITDSRRVWLYTRFSSDLQRRESCDDQEREVRHELDRKRIPHRFAQVVRDEGASGKRDNREGFRRVMDRVKSGDIDVLAVDELSRLSRSNSIGSILADLDYYGVRFIAVADGIDTADPNWEPTATFAGVQHKLAGTYHKHRLRRGRMGRVLEHGSVGDHCYGYDSVYENDNWAEVLAQGKKPHKRIEINEAEAEIIRKIYRLYAVEDWSFNRIAKWLNANRIPPSKRTQKIMATRLRKGTTRRAEASWDSGAVGKIIGRRKYIGYWPYGQTEVVYGSDDKKKQVPARRSKPVEDHRPQLQIVPKDLWDKAVAKRARRSGHFGSNPSTRCHDQHPRRVTPVTNLTGLVRCPECGSYFTNTGIVGGHRYLRCSQSAAGVCANMRGIRADRVQEVLARFLRDLCQSLPGWIDRLEKRVNTLINEYMQERPAELDEAQEQLRSVTQEQERLIAAIKAAGGTDAPLLIREIERLTRERSELEHRVERLCRHVPEAPTLDRHALVKRLAHMTDVIAEPDPQANKALRSIFQDVTAVEAHQPWKKRPDMLLRFRIDPTPFLVEDLAEDWQSAVEELTETTRADGEGEWFEAPLAELPAFRVLGPKIEKLQKEGLTYAAIAERLGVQENVVTNALHRYRRVQQMLTG